MDLQCREIGHDNPFLDYYKFTISVRGGLYKKYKEHREMCACTEKRFVG